MAQEAILELAGLSHPVETVSTEQEVTLVVASQSVKILKLRVIERAALAALF